MLWTLGHPSFKDASRGIRVALVHMLWSPGSTSSKHKGLWSSRRQDGAWGCGELGAGEERRERCVHKVAQAQPESPLSSLLQMRAGMCEQTDPPPQEGGLLK